jgi:putative transport protein
LLNDGHVSAKTAERLIGPPIRPFAAAGRRTTMIEETIIAFLRTQPVFTLFLLLAFGYLLGRIRIFGFQPGSVAGVLFASLLFGRLGIQIAPGAQAVGFALFIFSVGYQAGPRFLDVVRTNGLKYLLLAGVVAVSGCAVAYCAGLFAGLSPGAAAGILSGGLTSSPTLAAAQEAVRSGLIKPPAGASADQMLGSIGTAYAITYIFGLIGLILVIGILPKLLKIDLAAEARMMDAQLDEKSFVRPQMRAYRVTRPEYCQTTVEALRDELWDGLSVVKLRREGEIIPFDPQGHLRTGDEIIAFGDCGVFPDGLNRIGDEIHIAHDLDLEETTATLVVANRQIVGKTLGSLDLARDFGLLVTNVLRDHHPIPVTADLVLQRGDILSVVGLRDGVDRIQGVLGPVQTNIVATDMLAFALGIACGVLLGRVSVTIAGIPLGLGLAGGLLASGIVVGLIHSSHPNIGKFPEAARWIFMEFGLLIFIAAVGLRVGGDILETFRQSGLQLVVAGIFTTLTPLLTGYVFGRKVLRLEPVILFGALSGALTSGAALSIVTREAQSSAPALGYTGTYAFANIILSIAGTLMVLI